MFLLVLTSIAHAGEDDHPMSIITGDGIHIFTKGHTIAGKVKDKIIFGDVSTDGHKESSLTIKDDHSIIKTKFTNSNGSWGGILINNSKTMSVKLVKLDSSIPAFIISVSGKEYTVRVEAEDFQNNHFIKPTYILETADGEVSVKMQEGQACYMYSLHLIFMIYGTYLF